MPICIAAMGLAVAGLERVRPARMPSDDAGRYVRTNLAFAVATAVTAGATDAAVTGIGRNRSPQRLLGKAPAVVAVPLALMAYDLSFYWIHRLGHEWGPAWRIHSVHHSSTRLHWSNAARNHFIEQVVEGFVEAGTVRLLGLTPEQHRAYLAWRGMYPLLQHSNVELRSGALDWILSTPDLHRWHHSTDYSEGDTNYGTSTIIWDHCFGSFYRPDGAFDSEVGIGRMPDFPATFPALSMVPFRWKAIRAQNAATWFADTADNKAKG